MQREAADWRSDWRARLEANLKGASAQRVRALFDEMNPHLVGDKLFESRWTDMRLEAAVLIPIIERPAGPNVLLTVRSPDTPSHAGQISFPGGRVQADDDGPVATALRETEEEVGIRRDQVRVLGSLGAHKGGIGFLVTPVVGIVDPRAEISPCPREVAEVFEAPLSFVADLRNHILQDREEQGIPYRIFAAPYGPYNIWGLTAGILRSLAETLQDAPDAAGE